MSSKFVHLVEEAFGIPRGTFDSFFNEDAASTAADSTPESDFLPPQHRLRLIFYPAMPPEQEGQAVGPHKNMAGWLTFLMSALNAPWMCKAETAAGFPSTQSQTLSLST
ncbi:hypothetical protein EYZ11_008692 [Aspergillus tanneri]|nr:hypothetical protein EYZ11_008692 [Aspergillus tanneri]